MQKRRDFQHILTYLYALFIVLVSFWVYVKTLAPTVSFFDSGELIAAAHTLGVAHPPGYPLYVLLGWFFSKLPMGNIAYRLNLMSAFFAALASLMTYRITYIILTEHTSDRQYVSPETQESPIPERMLQPIMAMVAALTFAYSLIPWRHAVIAEVYSLNAFLCGLIVVLLMKWNRYQKAASGTKNATKSWLLYLVALVFGLGFGNHQTISLLSLAACFLVVITKPRILLSLKTLLLILVFLLLGLSIYLLVPLRAAQNPPINWGNPVNFSQFKWLISREGYQHVSRGEALNTLWRDLMGQKKERAADDPAPDSQPLSRAQEQQGLSRMYQIIAQSLFLKQLQSFALLEQFGYLGVALALLGLMYGMVVHRILTLTLLVAVLSLVLFVVFIGDPPEENIFLVAEFHTPAYLLVTVWIGMGAMAFSRAVLWVAGNRRTLQYGIVFVLSVFFLIPSASKMIKNLPAVDRRRNYVAYDYGSNVLLSLKPHAILFTWGDSGAFPLWYLQIVEDQRPDVMLIHVPHLSADWYTDSLPEDLFLSDSSQKYEGDVLLVLDEIIQKNLDRRPIYFDFSSTHSLPLNYPLLPNGVTYKVPVPGDQLDPELWSRYRFRGILDDTRIALDPDIERTFFMYGSARVELGNYYLDFGDLDKAASEFNAAVQIEPRLGEGIVHSLKFRDKLAGEQSRPAPQPKVSSK